MKKSTRVVLVTDPDSGLEGWKIKRIPTFQPTSAAGLAHDILEHGSNDKGTYLEEISAYGAIAAYRGDSHWLYPKLLGQLNKVEQLGIELADGILLEMTEYKPSVMGTVYPKKTYKNNNEVILHMANAANLEFHKSVYDPNNLTNWLYQWLMVGYTRVQKIIENCGWDPSYIWEEVFHTIDFTMFKSHISFYEGNEVSVQIDFNRCSCSIKPINCKELFN